MQKMKRIVAWIALVAVLLSSFAFAEESVPVEPTAPVETELVLSEEPADELTEEPTEEVAEEPAGEEAPAEETPEVAAFSVMAVDEHEHASANGWLSDEYGHWFECDDCGAEVEESHIYSCSRMDNCLSCGYAYADCEGSVNIEHDGGCKQCSGECEHASANGWLSDEHGHWFECDDCGAEVEENHIYSCSRMDNCLSCGYAYADCAGYVDIEHDGGCEECAGEHEHWMSCENPGVCGECGVELNSEDYNWGHDTWIPEEERDNWIDLGNGEHCLKCFRCGEEYNHGGHGMSCERPGVCWDCGAEITNPEDHNWGHDTWIPEEERDNWIDLGNGEHCLKCFRCGEEYNHGEHGQSCTNPGVCWGCGVALDPDEYGLGHNDWNEEEDRRNWVVNEDGLWVLKCTDCGFEWEEHECWVRCGNEGVCDTCGNPCDLEPQHDSWNREEDRENCYVSEDDDGMHVYVCDGCGEVFDEGYHGVSCDAEDKSVCTGCGVPVDPEEAEEWHPIEDWTLVQNPANPAEHGYYCPGCDQVVFCDVHWGACDNTSVCVDCGAVNPDGWENIGGHETGDGSCKYNGNGAHSVVCLKCGYLLQEAEACYTFCWDAKEECNACGQKLEELDIWHNMWDEEFDGGWVVNPENADECGLKCNKCGGWLEMYEHYKACWADGCCDRCWIELPEDWEFQHNTWIEDEGRDNCEVREDKHVGVCLDCGAVAWEEEHWVSCADPEHCAVCGVEWETDDVRHDSWDPEREVTNMVLVENGTMHAEQCVYCGFTWNENYHGVSCTNPNKDVCQDCGVSLEGIEYEDWHRDWIEEEERYNWVLTDEGWVIKCLDCGREWGQHECWVRCGNEGVCDQCGNPCDRAPEHDYWNREEDRLNCYAKEGDLNMHVYVCDGCHEVLEEGRHGVSCDAEDKRVCTDCGISLGEGIEYDDWHNDWLEEEQRQNWVDLGDGRHALECVVCGYHWEIGDHGVSCTAEDQTVCSACGVNVEGAEHEGWHNDWIGDEERYNWVLTDEGWVIKCLDCGREWGQHECWVRCGNEGVCDECGQPCDQEPQHDTWNREEGRPNCYAKEDDLNMHIYVCDGCGEVVEEGTHGVTCDAEDKSVCSDCGISLGEGIEYDDWHYEWIDEEQRHNWVDAGDGMHVLKCQVCGEITGKGYHGAWCTDPDTCLVCGADCEVAPLEGQYHEKVNVDITEDGTEHIITCDDCELNVVEEHFYVCLLEDRSACAECGMEGDNFELIHVGNVEDGICLVCGEQVGEIESVTAVEIVPAISTIAIGQEESIGVLVTGVAEKIEYKSSNAKVLAVDENGVLTAKKAGTATITVTATGADGTSATTSAKITVKKAPTKLALSAKTLTLGVNEAVTLTATLSPSGAYSPITWTSSDESIIEVYEDGKIYPVGVGTATVTAETFNGKTASCKITVKAEPSELRVNATEVKLNTKKTFDLKVEMVNIFGYECAGKISFTSADPSIATVSAAGKITAKKVGETTITVSTYNNATAEVKVGVYNVPKKVALNVAKATLIKGETLELIPEIAADAYTTYTYSTSAKKVATVDANGVVTAVAEGTATITVKTANNKKATAKIAVVDPYKPSGVELDQSGTVYLALGDTLQLNAELLPATAQSELTWSSKTKKVATVDANGLVTPLKEGSTEITVTTYNGKKDSVKVQVVDPKKVAAVELDQSGTVTLNLGETLELSAAILPATAETTLSWASSNARIATVADGVVTPVKEGTATITVKSANGRADTVKVKVVDPKKATAVELSEEGTVTIGVGEIYLLTAEVKPGTAETTLKWSSNKTKYAVVEEGLVLGVKAGTATITVQTANGLKDTVKVKVVDANAKANYAAFIGDWELERFSYQGVSISADDVLNLEVEMKIAKDSIVLYYGSDSGAVTGWTMDDGVLMIQDGGSTFACVLYGKNMLYLEWVDSESGEAMGMWFEK